MTDIDPLKECRDYTKKIFFFGTVRNKLNSCKIPNDVEPIFQNDICPDFLITKSCNTVLEHKYSLPREKDYIIAEICDCSIKYKVLKKESQEIHSEVIVALPETCRDGITNAIKELKNEEVVWIFNLNLDQQQLKFEQVHGNPKNDSLKECLLKEPLTFIPTDFSRIKFLRKDEPHPVYTAVQLWVQFKTYLTALTKEKYIDVTYDKLIQDLQVSYPQWVKDKEQLTKGRVNKALVFLKKIGFLQVHEGGKLRIFHTRGTKTDDLNEYFAKKWREHYPPEGGRLPDERGVQQTLSEF